jgi:hypothetical protein
MLGLFQPPVAASLGLSTPNIDCRVTAKVALSRGDWCEFDMSLSEAANMIVSDPDSGLATVIHPTEEGALGGRAHGWALENMTAGQKGMVRVRGICDVTATGEVMAGNGLYPVPPA